MGLSFSIQKNEDVDVSFSYAAFMWLRYHIVRLMGVDVGDKINIFETGAAQEIDKDHPLFDFIWHCDCDGQLSDYQCAAMGPVLKELLEKWAPTDESDQKTKNEGIKLANVMIRCGNEQATLIFH
jgi:hypothetical protein